MKFPKSANVKASQVDEDDLLFMIDTAGSWEGRFPKIGRGDFVVQIDAEDGDGGFVVVSRRYVGAIDHDDAGEMALDAFLERRHMEESQAKVVGVAKIV